MYRFGYNLLSSDQLTGYCISLSPSLSFLVPHQHDRTGIFPQYRRRFVYSYTTQQPTKLSLRTPQRPHQHPRKQTAQIHHASTCNLDHDTDIARHNWACTDSTIHPRTLYSTPSSPPSWHLRAGTCALALAYLRSTSAPLLCSDTIYHWTKTSWTGLGCTFTHSCSCSCSCSCYRIFSLGVFCG